MRTWRPTLNDHPSHPRGVTLLELLIVMTIMLMVTAAAIPVMMPALQNRRMREASRLASSFISGARARAIETGRPAGVMLERFNGLPMAMQLSYVEVPIPYAGDTLSSKVVLNSNGIITSIGIPAGANDSLWRGVIRFGDHVRLDYKGPLYLLASTSSVTIFPDPKAGQTVNTDPSPTLEWHLLDATGNQLTNVPAGYLTSGVPFQIIRQPIRSSATPLQLPEGTVVDLMNSGMGASGVFPPTVIAPSMWSSTPPVPFNPVILFSPNGSVASVTTNAGPLRPLAPIHLLIGRRDLMADVTQSTDDENLFDPRATPVNEYLSNFWVTVAHQTGQVSVAENARTTGFLDVQGGRAFAQTPQSAGGK
jgi:prepilin-type N-terminal cleavage/methylation domain-containing protein